jgi:rare lipoprotein A
MFVFSKLKNLLGAVAVIGTTLVTPSPSLAAGCSQVSFYGGAGDNYAWQTMANGQPMNPNSMITAHRHYRFGTRLRVTNQSNGKSVTVVVSDRGPFIAGRDLDLSIGAFSKIASPSQGVARVCYSRV